MAPPELENEPGRPAASNASERGIMTNVPRKLPAAGQAYTWKETG